MKFHTEGDLEWVKMFAFIAKYGNSCTVQSVLWKKHTAEMLSCPQSFSRDKSSIFQMDYFFIQPAFHFAGDSSISLLAPQWFPSKHNAP